MTRALLLLAHVALGAALGWLYFRGLWWNVRRFVEGRHPALTIALGVARFLALGAVLLLTSLEGAMPLLATALGLLAARAVVLRRLRQVPP
jgi:F1F0 ATPase subunit 2